MDMTFLLSEEQGMLRDSARAFLDAQSPVAVQRRLRDDDAATGFDPALWARAVDLGWTAAVLPERHGGLGVGYAGLGTVFEAMGRTLAALPLLSSVVACGELLLRAGDAGQQERWIPEVLAGERRFALAVDEGGRHAPHVARTRARREVGGWILEGEKRFVADGVGASWLIVTATLDDGSTGLFVAPCARPGVRVERTRLADSRNHARVIFEGLRVADDLRLNAAPDALRALDEALDRARACLAAEALGLTREGFARTLAYMKERVQFDVPIGSFQALQHRAARLYVQLELLESSVRAALAAIDAGAGHDEVALLASLAKARAADACETVLNEAVQLHGGIGVTDEFDLGLFLKRARVLQQSLGDAGFHRDRYATLKGF